MLPPNLSASTNARRDTTDVTAKVTECLALEELWLTVSLIVFTNRLLE